MTTATATAGSDIQQLRITMLNAGRAFSGVQQVANRSRTMTLNARLAASKLGGNGAAFSVVVQALDEVVGELSELVESVERCRAGAIRSVALFTHSEEALRLSLRAVSGQGQPGARTAPTTADALRPGVGAQWAEAGAGAPAGSLAATLWAMSEALRDDMLVALGSLQTACRKLARLIESVEVLAASHGFFIGINGVIEAAYIGQPELVQLAADLQALTSDIDAAVGVAKDQATSLVLLADASTRALRRDINESTTRRDRRAGRLEEVSA